MLKSNTPYMLRKDGTLLECGSIHPYVVSDWSDGPESQNKRLINKPHILEWFLNNSQNELTKQVIEKFNKNDYDRVDDIIEQLADLTNEEFCKVRTSNIRYKYGGDNGEIYFRIPKGGRFNWFNNIWKTVMENKDYISDVTVVKDTGTAYQPVVPQYCKIKGKDLKHIPVEELLTMRGEPVIESKEETKKDFEKIIRGVISKYDNEEHSKLGILETDPGTFVHKYTDDDDIDFSKFEYHKEGEQEGEYGWAPLITFLLTGGQNGSGEWKKYLEDVSDLFKELEKETGLKIDIQTLDSDIPDDVWTCEVLMYKQESNIEEGLDRLIEKLNKIKENS